ALQKNGQVLHCRVGGIVVGGLSAAPRIFVAQRLFSGKGEVLVMGIDVLLKIAGLRCELEDLLPCCSGDGEVKIEAVVVLGIVVVGIGLVGIGQAAAGLVVGRALRWNADRVMLRLRGGEI